VEDLFYLASASSGGGANEAYLITAVLAAGVVILSGLFGLIRVIWRTANIMRDMTVAVRDLTKRFDAMVVSNSAADG
jgi:hypothetical protein